MPEDLIPGVQIPLVPEMPGSLRSAKVWEWSGQGLDQGDEAAHYLSQYLNKSVRLIRYAGKLYSCSLAPRAQAARGHLLHSASLSIF